MVTRPHPRVNSNTYKWGIWRIAKNNCSPPHSSIYSIKLIMPLSSCCVNVKFSSPVAAILDFFLGTENSLDFRFIGSSAEVDVGAEAVASSLWSLLLYLLLSLLPLPLSSEGVSNAVSVSFGSISDRSDPTSCRCPFAILTLTPLFIGVAVKHILLLYNFVEMAISYMMS